MAIVQINKTQLKLNQLIEMPAFAAVDATDGAAVSFDKADHKILLMLQNTGEETKSGSILAGNGIQGVGDLPFSLNTGATYCAVIESGRFVNTSGPNKGKVVISGADADIKVACVVMA